MAKIFFSYATEDAAQIVQFRNAFEQLDVPVWIDHEQIVYGDSIPGKIDSALTECSGAILFISSNYLRKPWTTEERNTLIYHMVEEDEFKLVVVQLESCDVPPSLRHRLWANKQSPNNLANFFGQWLGITEPSEKEVEIKDFIQVIDNQMMERLALVITEHLTSTRNFEIAITFNAKQFGNVVITLVSPVTENLHDELRFQLRMIKTHDFFRREFQEKIAEGGLGIFDPAYKFQLEKRMVVLEESRRELRDGVDAVIATILKAEA